MNIIKNDGDRKEKRRILNEKYTVLTDNDQLFEEEKKKELFFTCHHKQVKKK